MWADSSFLPPWRAISTEKVCPDRARMDSSTALATSRWYGRSIISAPTPAVAVPVRYMLSAYYLYARRVAAWARRDLVHTVSIVLD